MSIVVEYNLRRRLKDQIERMTRSDPVSQYLRDNKPLMAGESVQIPTSLRGEIVRYTVSWRADTGLSVWRTNRTMNQYKDELFSDQFERGKVNLSKGIFEVKLRANRSDVIAGGINKAFAPGKTVLDLGSAKAIALLQFFRDFPKTMFIGVDTGYDRTEAVNINNPGVQLINDNWESLITIPDHSIDTLLSCAGAFTHGVH
ncbi:hypothetical protein HY041_00600 [Candidatus Roizmanbacteria bacterium]|nr:hypothetical protein [Candidatus Roizmanbacteria bacterium]